MFKGRQGGGVGDGVHGGRRVSESIQETLLTLKTWLGCHVLPGNLRTPGAEPGLI